MLEAKEKIEAELKELQERERTIASSALSTRANSRKPKLPSSASHGSDFIQDKGVSFENTKQFGSSFSFDKVGARPRARNMAGSHVS